MLETSVLSLDARYISERQCKSYTQPFRHPQPSRHPQCLPKTGTAIALDIREGEPTWLHRVVCTQASFSEKLLGVCVETDTSTSKSSHSSTRSKSSLRPGIFRNGHRVTFPATQNAGVSGPLQSINFQNPPKRSLFVPRIADRIRALSIQHTKFHLFKTNLLINNNAFLDSALRTFCNFFVCLCRLDYRDYEAAS
jgi:hypothetical protein